MLVALLLEKEDHQKMTALRRACMAAPSNMDIQAIADIQTHFDAFRSVISSMTEWANNNSYDLEGKVRVSVHEMFDMMM